jgi:hypothetical protein
MDQWIEIRQRVLREEVSKRQILRETGMHWKTLKKILNNASPPGYPSGFQQRNVRLPPVFLTAGPVSVHCLLRRW